MRCLSYVSNAVIKHHDQGNLAKKAFTLGLMVSEGYGPWLPWWGAWQQTGKRGARTETEGLHLIHKHKEQGGSVVGGGGAGNGAVF